MALTTVDRKPVVVACLRYTGPFGPAIGEFWRDCVQPWLAANNLKKVETYGVARDDPATTPAEKLRYDACVEVPAKFQGTGLYHLTLLPGGTYAVAQFHGTGAEIGPAWGALMQQDLPASGFRLDMSRSPFEHYPKDGDYSGEVFDCELLVPVEAGEAASA
jgi:AraC family transcriptional regulator